MAQVSKPFAAGWRIGKTLKGGLVGGAAGAAGGALTAGEGEDRWRAANRGALIGALAGGGVGLYRGHQEVGRANKILAHYKEPGFIRRFLAGGRENARYGAMRRAVKKADKMKTSSIHPVTMASFIDELEKIAYLKSMGIGAGIGAGVGAVTGAAADDKNRFRGAVVGALGGGALGAGAGAGVKAIRNGAAKRTAKTMVSDGGGI